MAEIKVDCRGETCPVPLVETRKALRKAKEGDIVEVIGTHPASKKEIPTERILLPRRRFRWR